ncbi:tRNA (adenosine(37)-N6)-threonylcarbamoyltransferase complex ATPase subunit type 1 TsaE [Microbulbifer hainanensis]|uniref:tRNA (adenosine(37)-N6)-threonylcarbamoyltransferase complex ATPase subunit type 1 TsaE n=1 Tax=Microbulbifer hainanensis TaxID=2735675 RepID=UPI0018665B91|nr:tRNA (adenosine(37)-N6)-threonylcarbamoyltransferase complex ATPase subunit type 1 TsaE [Microbulbifer hainanensis]
MDVLKLHLADEAATVAAGSAIGEACLALGMDAGLTLYLYGQLGAGKTTFCRGVLRAFGHRGAVKSPTYTLVEPYDFPLEGGGVRRVFHFDLYRLGDAEELEFMGVRDYFAPGCLSLVEWPQRGAGVLPEADLEVELEVRDRGRLLVATAHSTAGRALLDAAQKLVRT